MSGAPRVIVLGAGSIGRRHHENLQALGAVSDLISWREFSVAALQARLRTGVDAAVIATATDLRLPLIEACATAGVPAYIEKPLAFRPQDVSAILTVAEPIAHRSMLGVMMRYHPAFRTLATQDLSDIFQFNLSIGHDVTQWRANWRFFESYASQAFGGGVLLDLCHEIDMASCLFPGLAITAVESLGHPAYPGVDMASRISLTRDGLVGEVAMDYLTPQLHRRTLLRGTERMHDFDFAAQRYVTTTAAGPVTHDRPLERNQMFLAAMRDFLALVQGHPVSDVEHLPRLDLCHTPAIQIADAWQTRNFIGQTTKDIA